MYKRVASQEPAPRSKENDVLVRAVATPGTFGVCPVQKTMEDTSDEVRNFFPTLFNG